MNVHATYAHDVVLGQVRRRLRRLLDAGRRRHVADQLFRSATSVAANHRAACRARSHREFTAKLGIVLEEADEALFWLELLERTRLIDPQALAPRFREAREVVAIFAASCRTANEHRQASRA